MNLGHITRLARRDHRCAFCGLTVPAGQQYVRAPVPGGGRLEKRAFHSKCYAGLTASASTSKTKTEIPRGK